jgi:two-component system, cell cycle sensor histidine kinase and response regulator CckA
MTMAECHAAPVPSDRKGRILFVDDEETICETYGDMLFKLGYEVSTKISSVEALEAFRARPDDFDLVIMDQVMPHLNGLDLAVHLKIIRSNISIILCTGYSELITPQTASDFGIAKVLIKPVGIWQMREVVDSTFGLNGFQNSIRGVAELTGCM